MKANLVDLAVLFITLPTGVKALNEKQEKINDAEIKVMQASTRDGKSLPAT